MKKFWNWIRDDSGGRILRLEGPIDEDDFWGDAVTPRAFRDELEADTDDITVWVNSPGGSVFAAAEIYTMLRDYVGTVTVKVASVAASAASVVVMAGDVVQMSPTALLFLHDPSTIAFGNARDMEKAIQTLYKVKETDLAAVNALLANTGVEWSSLQQSILNSGGAAQQMADTQLDNLQGQLTLLKSALEGLAISFGEILLPIVKKVVSAVQSFVDWLVESPVLAFT